MSQFAAANLFIPPSLITEISQDIVKGDTDLVSLIQCNVKSTPFISASVLELISQLEAGSPQGKIYVETLTRSLVMYLIMHHSTAKFADIRALSKPDNPRVACAIDFIESHLGEDLSLAAIASTCNVSVNHLCAIFKRSVGQSVHQFIIERRIEKAKILLKNYQKSLVEIAQETGFSNQTHFTSSFHKICGITPNQYRKALI